MILAYAIVILIVIALVLQRDLSPIGRLSYRGGWITLILVIGLFILQANFVIFAAGQSTSQMILLLGSQILLTGLILLNYHIPGAKMFALGLILNIIVMGLNSGWMPITPETYNYVHPNRQVEVFTRPPNSKNIVIPQSETTLWILSDIIRVPVPWRRYAMSVGDVLLIAGVAQLIFLASLRKHPLPLVNQT